MRADEFAQRVDLTPAAHTHFHHNGSGIGVCGKHGGGNAEFVVLIALGGGYAPSRGKHVAHQVLRGSFAGRTGDSDHAPGDAPAPCAG